MAFAPEEQNEKKKKIEPRDLPSAKDVFHAKVDLEKPPNNKIKDNLKWLEPYEQLLKEASSDAAENWPFLEHLIKYKRTYPNEIVPLLTDSYPNDHVNAKNYIDANEQLFKLLKPLNIGGKNERRAIVCAKEVYHWRAAPPNPPKLLDLDSLWGAIRGTVELRMFQKIQSLPYPPYEDKLREWIDKYYEMYREWGLEHARLHRAYLSGLNLKEWAKMKPMIDKRLKMEQQEWNKKLTQRAEEIAKEESDVDKLMSKKGKVGGFDSGHGKCPMLLSGHSDDDGSSNFHFAQNAMFGDYLGVKEKPYDRRYNYDLYDSLNEYHGDNGYDSLYVIGAGMLGIVIGVLLMITICCLCMIISYIAGIITNKAYNKYESRDRLQSYKSGHVQNRSEIADENSV